MSPSQVMGKDPMVERRSFTYIREGKNGKHDCPQTPFSSSFSTLPPMSKTDYELKMRDRETANIGLGGWSIRHTMTRSMSLSHISSLSLAGESRVKNIHDGSWKVVGQRSKTPDRFFDSRDYLFKGDPFYLRSGQSRVF